MVVETEKGEKKVPPKSVLYIPPKIIHRVKNVGSSKTLALLFIKRKGHATAYVEKRDGKWQIVKGKTKK